MKEASPVKYYFAKYFFLAFGLMQWLCGMLLFLQADLEKSKRAALLFFTIGLACIVMYFIVAARLRRVAISKNRVTIFDHDKIDHYEWPEVKWIKMVPYFNLYKLKIRGKKNRIYFLPDHNVEPLFGIFPQQPELEGAIRKKVK